MNGSALSDEEVEELACAAESGSGWHGGHLGPPVGGPPVGVGTAVRSVAFVLDEERAKKLTVIARRRGVSPQRVLEDLVDRL